MEIGFSAAEFSFLPCHSALVGSEVRSKGEDEEAAGYICSYSGTSGKFVRIVKTQHGCIVIAAGYVRCVLTTMVHGRARLLSEVIPAPRNRGFNYCIRPSWATRTQDAQDHISGGAGSLYPLITTQHAVVCSLLGHTGLLRCHRRSVEQGG